MTPVGGSARPAVAHGVALDWTPRPLTDLFDRSVLLFGDRPAIDFMGRVTPYRELAAQVERAAAGLQRLGVVPGARVALCLPNMPAYPILYLATLRVGGVVVNVNPLYVERELEHLLRDSGAELIATVDLADVHGRVSRVAERLGLRRVVTCRLADALPASKSLAYRLLRRRDIAPPGPGPRHVELAHLLARRARPAPVPLRADDVAVLQYTGGTTGLPKAAMLTHASLVANADATVAHLGEHPEPDRIMGVLPLFHAFALTTVLHAALRTGAAMVLLPRFELKAFVAAFRRTRPTYLPAVPTLIGALAGAGGREKLDLSSLRACISGGAPLPSEVRAAFERAAGAPVIEGYGLSEASPIIACNPLGAARDGSAGLPFPGTTIEIRDPDDPGRIVPLGEVGEVCARGPQIMRGYWNKPDETAAVLRDGLLRTGDLGRLDEDGFLHIVDRLKDVILCGGYNVYPRVLEDALYEHPAVAEAVVIGVSDPYRGQAPKAFVVLSDPAVTPDQLRAFLAERVSRIEVPREIELRETLPKTLIGKLSKKELVEEERARAAP